MDRVDGAPTGCRSRASPRPRGGRSARSATPTRRRAAPRRCGGSRAAATRPSASGCSSTVRSRISSKLANDSGPGDEGDDRGRLVPVDARRDVHQDEPPHQLRRLHRQRERSQPAERHPDDGARVRCAARGIDGRDRARVLGGVVRVVVPPVGVAVAREVDREEGTVERERDGVPGVRVLGAAVQQHQLGLLRCPSAVRSPAVRARPPRSRARRSGGRTASPTSSAFSWNKLNSSYSISATALTVGCRDDPSHPAGLARRRRARDPRAARRALHAARRRRRGAQRLPDHGPAPEADEAVARVRQPRAHEVHPVGARPRARDPPGRMALPFALRVGPARGHRPA